MTICEVDRATSRVFNIHVIGEERRIYRVQDVCRKSRAWNVVIDQSQHSNLQTLLVFAFRACMNKNEAGQDDDNRDAYSVVELVQWFTRAAIKSVTSKFCSCLETI